MTVIPKTNSDTHTGMMACFCKNLICSSFGLNKPPRLSATPTRPIGGLLRGGDVF